MKALLIWFGACLVLGVGGGLVYLNSPGVKETKTENYLAGATPNPKAALARQSFTNKDHTYSLEFFNDARVSSGKIAQSANQQTLLARPGNTATSYVVLGAPIDDAHASLRSDCGTRLPGQVSFTVRLFGSDVSVCHDVAAPYSVYILDVRANGTWEQITLFNPAKADMTGVNGQLKTILGSLQFH